MNETAFVPVLISKYAERIYTARSIDGPSIQAGATSASAAFEAVKKQLAKLGRQDAPVHWPSRQSYTLHTMKVRTRLFYREKDRQFPASRELMIAVRYALVEHVDQSLECLLPDFDVVLFCPSRRELDGLVAEHVRSQTGIMSAQELGAVAPPEEAELRIVHVRVRHREQREDDEATAVLASVAQPFVGRSGSGTQSFSRGPSIARGPLIDREAVTTHLQDAIRSHSVLLVGETGCGKSTLIASAAANLQKVAKDKAKALGEPMPEPLVWRSSAEHLIAGMQYLGQWEERVEQTIAQLESIGAAMAVSSLVDLVRLGGNGAADSLAAFLLPFIQRGELRLIAETTADELDRVRRLLPGMAECFETIVLDPVSTQQTASVIGVTLREAARNHHVQVSQDTTTGGIAEAIATLFARFMPYQALPRGPVKLVHAILDETQHQAKPDERIIDFHKVVDSFSKLSGLPISILSDHEPLSADQVRETLSKEIIGQPAAVDAATDVVMRVKAGLCDPQRPIATLLFCGPTGVGKTQLAKTLAGYLFGSGPREDDPLIRLDMSEFGGYDSVDRLMIAPDGEVATWVGRLRSHPMSVLLLDEFEKASPQVHDTFLSALDEGRLTDRFGRTTTLQGSVVVLTSNVGSQRSQPVGFDEGNRRGLHHAIEKAFRPEFLNRLDEVVMFEPLPSEAIRQIVEKELRTLAATESIRDRRIRLTWSDEVVDALAEIGFDSLLGARPLQRAIQRRVVVPIARQMVQMEPAESEITIDLERILQIRETH